MRSLPLAALLVALAAPAAAQAPQGPVRKAGLWEQTMSMPGMPAGLGLQTSQLCTDPSVERKMSALSAGMGQSCTQNSMTRRPDDSWAFASTCTFAGRKSTSRGVARGDFNSSYTMEIDSTTGGGPAQKMSVKARYLGACRPGQRPGDMVLPGGIKMNILTAAGR